MSDSTPQSSALKVCSKCGESKPTDQFPKDRRSKDGLQSYCKVCDSAHSRAYRAANKSKVSSYQIEYRAANKEELAAYRASRKEQAAANMRAWRARNKEQMRANNEANRAVQRGILPPAWSMVCDGCDEAQAVHWHHRNGYDEKHWLDVTPLCVECHGKEHRTNV